MKITGLAVLAALCLFTAAVADPKEIPVDIKADRFKYSEDAGIMEAEGSVEVKFEAAVIRADRVRLSSATKIATAEGNVVLILPEYSATSHRLIYNAEKQTAEFSGYKADFSPRNLRGRLLVSADKVNDVKKKIYGGPGSLTTCDLGTPHFTVKAAQIEYFPEDRVEGRNVTVYVGQAPALWLPYLYYDLKQKRKKDLNIGHNEVEGDFVKLAWLYPGGLFLLDLIEKKGLGYGTQSDYGLGDFGQGSLYLYHLDEKDSGTSSWIEKISHQKQINAATQLKLNHSYIATYQVPTGRIDQTNFGLDLNYAGTGTANLKLNVLDDRIALYQKYGLQFDRSEGKTSTNYYFNYDFAKNDPKWLRNTQRFYHRRPLWGDKVNFSTGTNYYHAAARADDTGEEKIEPQIEFSGSEKDFSWRLTENWLVDLRQHLYPGVDRYEYVEKLPELEITPRSADLGLFNLQSAFGYGYYRESKYVSQLGRNRNYGATRLRATLNAGRSIPLKLGSTLALGAGLDQFLYSPGDQLYAFRETADLQTNLFSFFRNDVNFRQGYTQGNTPFLFDQLGARYHEIRERMTFFYQDKFNWTTDGGHNWQTNKWFDAMTSLNFSPDRRFSLSLNTGWDLENRLYKDLVAGLRLAPSNLYSSELSLSQNMNEGGLRYASALHNFRFLEGQPNQLQVRFSQVFDAATKEFKVRDIMLVKDLHCWELKYSYSDYRKEFSVIFSLKALPEEPFGFSTGRGFYFEGFDKAEREIKGLKTEGEVRRY